jgi:hypothetical protein
VVFAMIERREIHLSAVCLLRDYLTPENHLELLAEASHKTKFRFRSCWLVAFRGRTWFREFEGCQVPPAARPRTRTMACTRTMAHANRTRRRSCRTSPSKSDSHPSIGLRRLVNRGAPRL